MASLETVVSLSTRSALAAALEGLEQGAVERSMPSERAHKFACQALLGSVMLMQDVGDSPALLKDNVASPGGTTIAGLAALEERGTRGALIRMVRQAAWDAVEGRQR